MYKIKYIIKKITPLRMGGIVKFGMKVEAVQKRNIIILQKLKNIKTKFPSLVFNKKNQKNHKMTDKILLVIYPSYKCVVSERDYATLVILALYESYRAHS